MYYSQVKGQLEEAIKHLPLQHTHIFHPSLLLGNREEFRLGERIGTVFAKIISPLMFGRLRKYKPITSIQVAKAMLHAAQITPTEKITYYTYNEMLQLQ